MKTAFPAGFFGVCSGAGKFLVSDVNNMLIISPTIAIPETELLFRAIRAQGPGGQHVNKTSSAVQLKFDYLNSPSLPEFCKNRLQIMRDRRIGKDGTIIIKSQNHRSLRMNRQEAEKRLAEILRDSSRIPRKRRPTKPTRSSQVRRLNTKTKDARTKQLRRRVRKVDC